MTCIRARSAPSPVLALALLAALLLAVATGAASAAERHRDQRLVIRGDATAVDGPCDAGVCAVALTDGRFRGAPVGTGTYTASLRLDVARAFPNGEGGICAPLEGRIVLGGAASSRLVLAVRGDSCQDGTGPLDGASFTGLARFAIKRGTGTFAGASGTGVAVFSEDAAKHHRITLIGLIRR
jgi:hypothetical protein